MIRYCPLSCSWSCLALGRRRDTRPLLRQEPVASPRTVSPPLGTTAPHVIPFALPFEGAFTLCAGPRITASSRETTSILSGAPRAEWHADCQREARVPRP